MRSVLPKLIYRLKAIKPKSQKICMKEQRVKNSQNAPYEDEENGGGGGDWSKREQELM